MKTDPLRSIEAALVAQEVLLRSLANTDDQHARLLELHSRHVFRNIANSIGGIRGELSGLIYRNTPETDGDGPNE